MQYKVKTAAPPSVRRRRCFCAHKAPCTREITLLDFDVRPVVNDHAVEQLGIERCVLCRAVEQSCHFCLQRPHPLRRNHCVQSCRHIGGNARCDLAAAASRPAPGCARHPRFAGSPRCSRVCARQRRCAGGRTSQRRSSARTELHCRRAVSCSGQRSLRRTHRTGACRKGDSAGCAWAARPVIVRALPEYARQPQTWRAE